MEKIYYFIPKLNLRLSQILKEKEKEKKRSFLLCKSIAHRGRRSQSTPRCRSIKQGDMVDNWAKENPVKEAGLRVCVMCFIRSQKEAYNVQGRVWGQRRSRVHVSSKGQVEGHGVLLRHGILFL